MDTPGLMSTVLLLLFLCPIYCMSHFLSYLCFFRVNQKDELFNFYFLLLYFPHFWYALVLHSLSIPWVVILKMTPFILNLLESSKNSFTTSWIMLETLKTLTLFTFATLIRSHIFFKSNFSSYSYLKYWLTTSYSILAQSLSH